MSQEPARHRGWLWRRPTFGGVAVALLFWWWSLDPSMLPRAWSAQAAVSGLSAAIGYLLGTLAGYGVAALLGRLGRTPSPRVRRYGWLALGVVAVVVVVAGLALWPGWQNQQRDLVGMEHVAPGVLAPMAAATLVVFGLLFLVGRVVGHGIVLLDRLLAPPAPPPGGPHRHRGLVPGRGRGRDPRRRRRRVLRLGPPPLRGRRHHHRPGRDGTHLAGRLGQPGLAGSVGDPGRVRAQLRGSDDEPGEAARLPRGGGRPHGTDPGLRRAALGRSPDERAALAVRELERTGAFRREVLAVVTVTGTGWVDPDAASSIEYLHGGDTALVGLQYSNLPSWISFLVDRDEAAEAGTALYRHVHRRWSELPAESRPRLIIFGESLGSYGAEAAFGGPDATASLANLVDGADGALFTGPTEANRIWNQLTDDREPGSPVWRPVYSDGTRVRFANRPADLGGPDQAWTQPRVLYVHHPSDPVGNWRPDSLWRRPEWTEPPNGYDIPARAGWFPIVTGVQEVADLIAGFSAPSGYGHNYAIDFVSGWAAVVPPARWTEADSARLQQHLAPE